MATLPNCMDFPPVHERWIGRVQMERWVWMR
jgi:hypothetical protein